MERLGTHCILDLHDCPKELIEDPVGVASAIEEASRRGMTTLLQKVTHRFHPQGVTAVAILAESHMSIHTWPEYRYAAVDVFTCGPKARPQDACRYLVDAFRAGRHHLLEVARGGPAPEVEQGVVTEPDSAHDAPADLTDEGEADLCPVPTFAQTSG